MSVEDEITRTPVEQVAHELMKAAPANWQHCPEVARAIDYLIKLRIEQALTAPVQAGATPVQAIRAMRAVWEA